uniref:Uncharacterized protein n=1 Tax=Sphaerodactylus townsendi TaxID=933632 RepID=A0ACB8G8L8_9SAUR
MIPQKLKHGVAFVCDSMFSHWSFTAVPLPAQAAAICGQPGNHTTPHHPWTADSIKSCKNWRACTMEAASVSGAARSHDAQTSCPSAGTFVPCTARMGSLTGRDVPAPEGNSPSFPILDSGVSYKAGQREEGSHFLED